MKKRIRIPNLPAHIIRQYPLSIYKDTKTGDVYTLKSLQRLYGDKHDSTSTKEKESLITPEMKHEQITNSRWDLNY